jgi:hypothetical protein
VVASVLYSIDDGTTWWPLAMQSGEDALDVNPSTLPSSDRARLRLTASDGVNTTVVDLAGHVTVQPHAPVINIVAPTGRVQVRPGQPLLVSAEAADVDEPLIDDAAIQWTVDGGPSARDGSWTLIESLPTGTHEIAASITDRDGLTATASISIVVSGGDWTAAGEDRVGASRMSTVAAGLALALAVVAIVIVAVIRRRRA